MAQAQSVAADYESGKPGWFTSAFRVPHAPGESTTAAPRSERASDKSLASSDSPTYPAGEPIEALAPNLDMGSVLGRIRQTIAALRASEERVSDLKAGLQAVTDRAKLEIQVANDRADAAETLAASEAARADAADQRWREAESRFGEILNLIAEELDAPS
jgi:hypothetical protein